MTSVDLDYVYEPGERALFPGSPPAPKQSRTHRVEYALIGAFVGISATFGNALVNVNVASMSGNIGLYVAEASWFPAIYVGMNASANLTLVKARTQFGVANATRVLLAAYVVVGLLQIALPGPICAGIVRAVCGLTAAGLTTLAVYYFLQAFPGPRRPLALLCGIGVTQLGTPLARLVPVDVLSIGSWSGIQLIEVAVALGVLAITSALPLPPSDRSPAFERRDLLTIALLVPGYLLVSGVLGVGRILWWSDTPWLGHALIAAVVLFAAAILLERNRCHPLLQLRWIATIDILRFAGVALFVRLALAEQTYGAVGILMAGGLTNDQLHGLFTIVAVAMVGGILTAAFTLSEKRLPYQIIAAAACILLGAWLDTTATNLTRPPELYLSQALLGFGTTLFMGPALVYGFIRMFSKGAGHLVSFVVLFSTTQNLGGLAGSALLGSYQVIALHFHSATLAERIVGSDPQVAARIQSSGAAALAQSVAREAAVLAYIDVFRLVAALALAIIIYIGIVLICTRLRSTSLQHPGVSS